MSYAEDHLDDHRGEPALGSGGPLLKVLTVLLISLLLAAIYGRLMGFGLSRDEMMYASPAVLLEDQALYSDFFFNHVPYSAWIVRGFYLLTGGEDVLFSARLMVFVAWVLLACAVGFGVRRLSGSIGLAAFCVIALLSNDLLLSVPGMTGSNNFLPLPFAFLGLSLFLMAVVSGDPRFLPMVLAGICLSVAVGMKVSAAAFVPVAAIAAFFLPFGLGFGGRLRRVVFPFALGGLIGAIPLIGYLAADPDLFIAHVLDFHTGPHIAYWEANQASEPGLVLGLGDKLRLAFGFWLNGSNLLVAFLAVLFVISLIATMMFRYPAGLNWWGAIVVTLGTLALTAGMSLLPTPSFPQYFVQPLICVPLLLALLYRELPEDPKDMASVVMVAAAIMLVVVAAPRLASAVPSYIDPGQSTVAKTARGGAELRRILEENGIAEGPVATFMPIYPLEGELEVYPEFATGQFAYRIVPFTDPELLAEYRAVGPAAIDAFFRDNPPAAILIGFEPELERPFVRYAVSQGYRKVPEISIEDRYGRGILYVRPTE